jgi:hypothetical protein
MWFALIYIKIRLKAKDTGARMFAMELRAGLISGAALFIPDSFQCVLSGLVVASAFKRAFRLQL